MVVLVVECVLFFFQAEDGIRDHCVTGVQTCALPICSGVALGQVTSRVTGVVRDPSGVSSRSEEHTSELQSHSDLVCRLLLEKKKKKVQSKASQNEIKIT